ncbi:4-hydroxy-tetrahydrodipicolinate synthase [Rhodoferax sp. GW822-FHT02A01]|uniref:4-hydroxy-tetrahydrodipicolinate synthase n=1 Tax=Rhodoferax sp. GW822-FHT02A01 TaxID=3141537 RepID=UPI00315CE9AC
MPTAQTVSPSTADFSGLWIPLITPFTADTRAVDHVALKRLLAHYRQTGIAGYVVCGSTGEAAALSKQEQWEVLETVLEHADGLPAILGYSGYNLQDALAFVRKAADHPLHGLLVAAPHYIRPSQDGLLHWFETIASAASQPVLIYDIPYRTGVEMSVQTLQHLALHPNIQGIKDCGGSAAKTQQLIADGQLQVLAGEDHQIFSTVAAGGRGAIAASSHVRTEDFAAVIRLISSGDLAEARAHWKPLVPLVSALFAEPNPACIKSALAQMGLIDNSLREPMMPARQAFAMDLLEKQFATA